MSNWLSKTWLSRIEKKVNDGWDVHPKEAGRMARVIRELVEHIQYLDKEGNANNLLSPDAKELLPQ